MPQKILDRSKVRIGVEKLSGHGVAKAMAGGASREVRDRFEAVARLAGQLLASSPLAAAQVSDVIVAQSDPLVRWLMAVPHLTGRFEFGFYGTLQDASGTPVGHMLMGTIPNVIDASALACLHLATTDAAIQPHVRSTTRLFIDQIDSFSEVRRVEPSDALPLLTMGRIEASEDEIQACLERILGVPLAKKDWGGEENDLYTANLVVDGQRQPTAFMLKAAVSPRASWSLQPAGRMATRSFGCSSPQRRCL